jgi:hypothetical protein
MSARGFEGRREKNKTKRELGLSKTRLSLLKDLSGGVVGVNVPCGRAPADSRQSKGRNMSDVS